MSNAEQILKYKELLDLGAISQDEYDIKKSELLNANEPSCYSSNNDYGRTSQNTGLTISTRTTSILAYITWIGFLIALFVGDSQGAKFHINQALVINLFSFLCIIPVIGYIWAAFMVICWILGLIYACNQQNKEVPLIGKVHLLK